VPTYAATASRSAENAFVTLISSWYLDAGGTFTVFGKQPYYSLNPNTRTFEVNDNSGNNLIGSTFSAGGVGQGISIVSGSSNFAPSTANTTASYTTFKVGIAGSAAGKKVCLNGGAVATNATVPPLTGLTKLSIGCNSSGTNNFGGWISALRYYNTVLSDAQLQAATT
jgi:hypothetical protein